MRYHEKISFLCEEFGKTLIILGVIAFVIWIIYKIVKS